MSVQEMDSYTEPHAIIVEDAVVVAIVVILAKNKKSVSHAAAK